MSQRRDRIPGAVSGYTERHLPGDASTKAYVGQVLQGGVLKQSVLEIVTAPPASPKGGLYIIGASPTGDFAGKAGMLAIYIPGTVGGAGTWVEVAVGDKERRLVESDKTIYEYDAATSKWAKAEDKIGQLADVETTSVANKQILVYDAAAKKWKPSSRSVFEYHNNVSHFDIPKPADATQVLEATLDIWLIGEAGDTFPTFQFLGFSPFQIEDGNWHSSTHYASQVAHDSAPTAYINGHNVTGSSIKLGYIGGGTGHSLGGGNQHIVKIRVKSIHQAKTLFYGEYFAARKSDAYPVFHQFKGIIGQPFSSLTGLRLTIANNAFTCDAQIKGE